MFSVSLNTPPCTPLRSRQPTAGALLAAAHGDEPGSAVHPCVSRLDLHLHPLGLTMRKRYPTQHTRPLIHGTPTPAPRRRRRTRTGADHAANAVTPIVRDPSSKHP
jgi:hypothetical protein